MSARLSEAPRVLALCVLLTVALHFFAFLVPHLEGDEQIYLTLGYVMGWDLSPYNIADTELATKLPDYYQRPLFTHPPLFPLVLKLGFLLDRAVQLGLAFNLSAMILILVAQWRWALLLELRARETAGVLLATTFCPLLLFGTMRLHIDVLWGAFALAAVSFTLTGLERDDLRWIGGGTLCAVLSLNAKFTAILALPLFLLPHLLDVWRSVRERRAAGGRGAWREELLAAERRERTWIHLAALLLVGGQHYLRFFAEYGTLVATDDATREQFAALSAFSRSILERTPVHMALYLLAILPFLLIFLGRPALRMVRAASRSAGRLVLVAGTAYLAVAVFALFYQQMRYLSPLTPFVYLCVPLLLREASRAYRAFAWGLIALTVPLALSTAVFNNFLHATNAKIVPAIVYWVPALAKHYL